LLIRYTFEDNMVYVAVGTVTIADLNEVTSDEERLDWPVRDLTSWSHLNFQIGGFAGSSIQMTWSWCFPPTEAN